MVVSRCLGAVQIQQTVASFSTSCTLPLALSVVPLLV